MDLKIKDIKLLTSLFENSRQSNRHLAKELMISKETIAYKINYFLDKNIIKGFSLKVNYSELGFKEYTIFIRLKNLNSDFMDKIISYLQNHPNVTWIGKSFGKYDLKISIILKDINKINLIIHEISNKFSINIDLIDFVLVIDKFKANPNLFLENLFNEKISFKSKEKKKKTSIIIDDTDKEILYLLGQNPKIEYVKIATKVNLTAEAIKYRVKKLESAEIILGNSIVFNGTKFNKVWCLVLLNISSDKIEEFKVYLKKQVFLSNYSETMGIWNFNVTIFAKDMENLYSDLNLIRSKYGSNIRNFEFLIFFEFYKFPQVPTCIKD